MSAFLCSDRHLAHVVAWAYKRGLVTSPRAAGTALRSLNNASLVSRYGSKGHALRHFDKTLHSALDYLEGHFGAGRSVPLAQYVYALLGCLQYQCDEGDTLKSHPAGPLLERITQVAGACAGNKAADGVWSI